MMKPNLFAIATKELSQDAFIAWLLQWADPGCRELDPDLNAVAVVFVKRLISLQGEAPAKITSVNAVRQWEHIDVWAEVNDSHAILIEDKTGTGQHSGQLARYRRTGEDWCKENDRKLVCIYIKTHSESSSNRKKLADEGYAMLDRREFLEVLDAHEPKSDIFQDFRANLRELESCESQYGEKLIGEWNANDWKGFYQDLERRGEVLNWGYVPNQSGGFLNAVLNWFDCGDVCFYMQIEQGKLCFKVGEVYEDRGAVRWRFHQKLMDAAGPELEISRPGRFGSGCYMTVGIASRQVWLGKDDEIVNVEAVVERLRQYHILTEGVAEEAEGGSEIPA